jgi:hypothetical protein
VAARPDASREVAREDAAAEAVTAEDATVEDVNGEVVALTATGASRAGGVTTIMRIPTATRPIDPVAIANPRVERCTSVCRIACRSAAATSDG